MKNTTKQDEKMAKMIFSSIYPHYLKKNEKKVGVKMNLTKLLDGLQGMVMTNY